MGAFNSYQIKKMYPGKDDQEIYRAALLAIPNAGYDVWKKRDLLTLAIGKGNYKDNEVFCDILVNLNGGSAKISARAQNLDEEDLKKVVEIVGNALDKLML